MTSQQPSSNRSIQIGGNVSGGMIVSGDNNTVTHQTSTVAGATSTEEEADKCKLLLLAANPHHSSQLRLDEEVRDIREGLQRARDRDRFEIAQRWAVRSRDVSRALLEELPQIVHFSGRTQGSAQREDGLHFEDETGQAYLVSSKALTGLFRLYAQRARIECVVLNGCYSQEQATAIAQQVTFVVGLKSTVSERAAIEFAVGFYDALGSGGPIKFAFESGEVAMDLSGAPYEEAPLLLQGAAAQ